MTVDIATKSASAVDAVIDPFFTNDWDRLIFRTLIFLAPLFRVRGISDDSAQVIIAEKVWFRYAMTDTRKALEKGKLKSLYVEEKDNMLVVVGRASTGLQKMFGKEYLPIVMGTSRVAYLIMLWAHKENHDARDITMSIACSKAWIIGASRLASSIVFQCVRCRFLHKVKVEQKMAILPPAVQLPCPPFTNIGLDLCGPLTVHAMTNKRATMKVWNVIFVCLNTKAVTMYLAPGYATDDFLLAYDGHVSDHGNPAKVHSDRGSQLVAAEKDVVQFDWDLIAEKSGTTWDFTPSGAQWRR